MELWECLVYYHVLGVRVSKYVIAQDEIDAWEIVKKDITTKEYWLENVLLLRRISDPNSST